MPRLTNSQIEQLLATMLDAFDRNALGELLQFHTNRALDQVVSPDDNLRAAILKVINAANREGWIASLLHGVAEMRSDSADLQQVVADLLAWAEAPPEPPPPPDLSRVSVIAGYEQRLVELRDALVNAFEELPRAREITRRAGIAAGTTPPDRPAREWWWDVIQEMQRQGKLAALVDAAIADEVVGAHLKQPFVTLRTDILRMQPQPAPSLQVVPAAAPSTPGAYPLSSQAPPTVLISYSHDSADHDMRVLKLADRLRVDGIESILDQYVRPAPLSWYDWMDRQLATADYVLLVCTENYLNRMGDAGQPSVRWESTLTDRQLGDMGIGNARLVPVLLSGGEPRHIPARLRDVAYYEAEVEDGYVMLYRYLRSLPVASRQRAVSGPSGPQPASTRGGGAEVEVVREKLLLLKQVEDLLAEPLKIEAQRDIIYRYLDL